MDYSPPGSTVHGILQARILEWAANFLPQGTFPTQGSNLCLLNGQVESRRKAFIKWGLSFYDLWSQQKHCVCAFLRVYVCTHMLKKLLSLPGPHFSICYGNDGCMGLFRSSSNACFHLLFFSSTFSTPCLPLSSCSQEASVPPAETEDGRAGGGTGAPSRVDLLDSQSCGTGK